MWGRRAALSAVELSHNKHTTAAWLEDLGSSDGFYKTEQQVAEAADRLYQAEKTRRQISALSMSFDMDMDDLNCLYTRQLASQTNIPVAICATYNETSKDNFEMSAEGWDIAGSESFPIEAFSATKQGDGKEEAALYIFQQFERRDIRTGVSDGIHIEILDGISAEDRVKKPGA